MSTFTPGPWQIKRLLLNPDEVVAVGDADGWFVADCQTTARPVEEIAANARLIAQAPAMLDALVELWEAGEWVWNEADEATIFTIRLSERDHNRLFIETAKQLTDVFAND